MRLGRLMAAAIAIALAAPAAAQAGDTIHVLTTSQQLYVLDSDNPGALSAAVNVLGFGIETIEAIDMRPVTNELYGIGIDPTPGTGRIYRLDPVTGAAQPIGNAKIAATYGASLGMDFNPVVDRIRVVDNNEENSRVNPNTGALAGNDTNLAPANFLASVAYDRNDATTALTTLYGIEVSTGELVRIGGIDGTPSSNGGVVTNVGPLGVTFNLGNTAFDIAPNGNAYLAGVLTDNLEHLLRVNLGTGAATDLGLIGDGNQVVDGLAVQGTGATQFAASAFAAAEGAGTVSAIVRRAAPATSTVTFDYATSDGSAGAADYTPATGTVTFAPGETEKTIPIALTADSEQEQTESLTLTLTRHDAISSVEHDATGPLGGQDTTAIVIADDDVAVPPPAKDTTAPVVLVLDSTAKLASRIRVPFACSEACVVKGSLRQGSARRASTSKTLTKAGKSTLTFKLSKATRRKLRRVRRLTVRLEATDAAGNKSIATARLTLKR